MAAFAFDGFAAAAFAGRVFFAARAAFSLSIRAFTVASSRCASQRASVKKDDARPPPYARSKARTASGHRAHADSYAPVETSSFVAPAVSKIVIASSTRQPSSEAGRVTGVSSNSTRPPREPPGFTGVHGITCFCPESAIAANQSRSCGRRRNARIAGFWPLLTFS